MRLKCFGVGNGWACPDRNHSSYFYRLGPAGILIDCGEPICRSYKAAGLSFDLVDRICLSHLHFDHSGGFFMLMQAFWLERKRDLVVHLPGYAIPRIQQMLEAAYIFPELLPFKVSYEPLQAGAPIEMEGARITAFPTTHVESFQRRFSETHPMPYEAFSFLCEGQGRRLGHSADIGAVEDLDPLLEKPLDLLVCELAHVKPEALFRYLRGRDVGKVLFVHLSDPLWRDLDGARQLAARLMPGMEIEFPKDGAEFEF